jgi:queuine tRNA-ribosyltransferase
MYKFEILKVSSVNKSRRGVIHTPHGKVETPAFIPVGTQGAVKGISSQQLEKMGYKMILCNIYHLYLRPGIEVIEEAGGLHKLISWKKAIMTDSGGYQLFSLQTLRKIYPWGVKFQSHIDGSYHEITPEDVISWQMRIGVDLMMPLDICLPYPTEISSAKEGLELTNKWAEISHQIWKKNNSKGILFGIIQGNFYPELRKEATLALIDLDLPGYALGGLNVGEPPELTWEMLDLCTNLIPNSKIRYFMGVGKLEDIEKAINYGVDIFDCVIPTRHGRTGEVFSSSGTLRLRHSKFTKDFSPIDPKCNCMVCQNYTRAYLRHLILADELLGPIFCTYHNLYFMAQFIEEVRQKI